jgi:hypothetical protein
VVGGLVPVRERDLGRHDRIVVGRVGRRCAQTVLQFHLETAGSWLDVEWRRAAVNPGLLDNSARLLGREAPPRILASPRLRRSLPAGHVGPSHLRAPCGLRALPVRIGSPLGLLLGDIAIPLRALRSLVGFTQVSPSRVASLCPTLLATTHRRRDEQHKEHDRDRDDDHDDTGTHREDRDKGDAQDPISSIACSSVSPDRLDA